VVSRGLGARASNRLAKISKWLAVDLQTIDWRGAQMIKAILRDVQLWIPLGVLVGGILLLIAIH
jgi:sensor c-di-GMP phosphodiesterase-like protein